MSALVQETSTPITKPNNRKKFNKCHELSSLSYHFFLLLFLFIVDGDFMTLSLHTRPLSPNTPFQIKINPLQLITIINSSHCRKNGCLIVKLLVKLVNKLTSFCRVWPIQKMMMWRRWSIYIVKGRLVLMRTFLQNKHHNQRLSVLIKRKCNNLIIVNKSFSALVKVHQTEEDSLCTANYDSFLSILRWQRKTFLYAPTHKNILLFVEVQGKSLRLFRWMSKKLSQARFSSIMKND